jgi:serine protease Do
MPPDKRCESTRRDRYMSASAKLATLATAAGFAVAVGVAATAFQQDATAVENPQPTIRGSASTITLPDFSVLVERNADTVVNVTSEGKMMAQVPGAGPAIPFPFRPPPGAQPFGDEPPVQRGMGSGFIISADGYIVTNYHVVAGAEHITVKLNDKREFPAKLVGGDKQSDVALLKIEAQGLPVVQVGNSNALKVGQWVFAIGAPFGLERTATQGIVSALGRSLPNDSYVPFIQTDVAVNPGNSGGPLFDTSGNVVGINSQIFSRSGGYMGLSFAIPINVAMDVVAQLKEHGYVEHGWLGIQLQEVTQDLARSFGLEKPNGALVANVTPASPADKAGLKTGDVIVAYADKPIVDSSDLPPLVGATRPGTTMPLTVMREGKQRKLDVTLGKLEDREVKLAANGEGSPQGATLNVVVSDLTDAQRQRLGVEHGVLVRQVGAGVAADAGVQPGDVLLQIDGKNVDSAQQLRELAANLPTGRSVPVLVKRGQFSMFLALRMPEDRRG